MYTVAEEEKRVFEFEVGGAKYSIPSVSSMSFETACAYSDAAKSGDDLSFVRWVIDNIFPEESREALSALSLSQIRSLMQAYIADGGVTPGESQA